MMRARLLRQIERSSFSVMLLFPFAEVEIYPVCAAAAHLWTNPFVQRSIV